MLKLVVDNTQKVKNKYSRKKFTCRNSCEWFDPISESCIIRMNVNVDSEHELRRCMEFIPRTDDDYQDFLDYLEFVDEYDIDFDYDDGLLDDDDIFHELVGTKESPSPSKYPLEPDYPSRRDDATWYVSPDGTFGCWIINHYDKPMPIPESMDKAEKGWSKRVYKSPVPLHDHKTSKSLASKMAWYVDESGYGQYVLLVNGKISQITAPKPLNWKGK